MLNWWLQDEYAAVVTDTLAAVEGPGPAHAEKARVHPQAEAISAHYRADGIFGRWLAFVESVAEESDIDALNAAAPAVLAAAAGDLGCDRAAMVLIVGHRDDGITQRIVGFAYRAARHFASELLANGSGFSPPLNPGILPLLTADPNSLIDVARAQAREDAGLPPPWRRRFGGCLLAHQAALGSDGRPHLHACRLERLGII